MAKVRPKKKPTVVGYGGITPTVRNDPKNQFRMPRAPLLKRASTKPVGVGTTSTPNPSQATVQQMMSLWQNPRPMVTPPPMPSLQSTQDRIAARNDFSGAMGNINQQLRNLAANYGGVDKILQFGFNPDAWDRNNPNGMFSSSELGVQANQPGSTLETLLRQLNSTKQGVNEAATAGNTFFSGKRINDLGIADTEYAGQVAQARRDYEAAVAQLMDAMTGAQGTLSSNLNNADIADIGAANATNPEAQASGPMSGQEILNSLPFTLEISRGATWAVYPDGHKEVLSGTPVAPYKKPKPKKKKKK